MNSKTHISKEEFEILKKENLALIEEINLIKSKNESNTSINETIPAIIHEVRNPLSFIMNSINVLKLNYDYTHNQLEKITILNDNYNNNISKSILDLKNNFSNKDIKNSIKVIQDAADRIQDITLDISNVYNEEERVTELININDVLSKTVSMIDFGEIKIVANYDESPSIEFIKGKAYQIFINLLLNAKDAIKEKKKRNSTSQICLSTNITKDKVQIKITDNGKGMSSETKKKLFKPFYSTKKNKNGSGLGMTITKNIIERHGGKIHAESELNKGTTFILEFPISK